MVLVAPEVHWNTGNIGRTCLGTDTTLHLIKPLGFSLDSKQVKRAGLDYWERVKLNVWDDFSAFLKAMTPREDELCMFTKGGGRLFWDMPVLKRMFLVFGSETRGLPCELTDRYETYKIPMTDEIRCLNLSTSVGIALYQSLRP